MFNFRDTFSQFLGASLETSATKRIARRSLKAALTTAWAGALLHLYQEGLLPFATDPSPLVGRALEGARIDAVVLASTAILIYGTGGTAMTLLERLMKPLIEASEARGEARGQALGEARAEQRFQEWKERQVALGAVFFPDDDPPSPADLRDS